MEISSPTEAQAALLDQIEDQFFKTLPPENIIGEWPKASRQSAADLAPDLPADGSTVASFSGEITGGDAVETLKRLAEEQEYGRIKNVSFIKSTLLTGNLTKTDRRILAREYAAKSATEPWVELDHYQHIKRVVKANRSGSKACACGTRISANKTSCADCASNR